MPGNSGLAQPLPHEVTPTSTRTPPYGTISGPPLSPWQVSVAPLAAQTIVLGSNALPYRPQSLSARIGAVRFQQVMLDGPLGEVVPQPTIVAVVFGAQMAFSSAADDPQRRIRRRPIRV